ncbi:GIY-YIG nuclease family protein [Candidatus Parcubacteria bacterium]|jgi:putative endonuclease|nr:MAG: GIY-YIG nuclease family protein [Candidatus Parcubacteria bacterium]
MHYVYLLTNRINQTIYIGSTNNLKRRIQDHNKGLIFSTKRYLPWKLIYYEAYSDEALARRREKRLKYHGNSIRELKKRAGIT